MTDTCRMSGHQHCWAVRVKGPPARELMEAGWLCSSRESSTSAGPHNECQARSLADKWHKNHFSGSILMMHCNMLDYSSSRPRAPRNILQLQEAELAQPVQPVQEAEPVQEADRQFVCRTTAYAISEDHCHGRLGCSWEDKLPLQSSFRSSLCLGRSKASASSSLYMIQRSLLVTVEVAQEGLGLPPFVDKSKASATVVGRCCECQECRNGGRLRVQRVSHSISETGHNMWLPTCNYDGRLTCIFRTLEDARRYPGRSRCCSPK